MQTGNRRRESEEITKLEHQQHTAAVKTKKVHKKCGGRVKATTITWICCACGTHFDQHSVYFVYTNTCIEDYTDLCLCECVRCTIERLFFCFFCCFRFYFSCYRYYWWTSLVFLKIECVCLYAYFWNFSNPKCVHPSSYSRTSTKSLNTFNIAAVLFHFGFISFCCSYGVQSRAFFELSFILLFSRPFRCIFGLKFLVWSFGIMLNADYFFVFSEHLANQFSVHHFSLHSFTLLHSFSFYLVRMAKQLNNMQWIIQ